MQVFMSRRTVRGWLHSVAEKGLLFRSKRRCELELVCSHQGRWDRGPFRQAKARQQRGSRTGVRWWLYLFPRSYLPDSAPVFVVIRSALKFRRRNKIRSEEHTSELQSLMRISYAVFCLNKKKTPYQS